MPLYQDAADLIREQLDRIRNGHRVPLIAIGYLTETQHQALREFRASQNLAGGESPEIVYIGRHHFHSRSAQGYTVDDMSQRSANATMQHLAKLAKRPLVDAQYYGAFIASNAGGDGDAYGGSGGVLQLQFGGNAGSVQDLDVERYHGCWFVRF